jgi:hypothetical protein
MAEQLNLTTSQVVPQRVTSYYMVSRLVLDWDAQRILVGVRGEQGERRDFTYEGDTARTMMVALNKANLTANSLQRRVLERLSSDGLLAGTVAGTPD